MANYAAFVILLFASTQVVSSIAAQGDAPGQIKKLQGELSYVTLHEDGEQWVLRNSDGFLTPIDKKTFKPPSKDKDGKEFMPGGKIELDCDIDGDGVCRPTAGAAIAALGSTSGATTAATSITATPPVFQRLLVMLLNYGACNLAPSLSEAATRAIFLGPNNNGLGGVAQKYTQCSYGKFNLNVTSFRVITVKLNCSTTVTASCSWWAMSNGADTAAKAMLGTTVFSSFTHYAYVLPPGLSGVCPWSGLALLPGKQIWLQTSSYGVNRWATVMQEALHNYGLWHSWQNGREYDDYSTAMGRGDACPNAAEISRMGWATPALGGGAIGISNLTQTGVARTFLLPATYITGTGNYLRVIPNWLSSYTNALLAKNLYIAVRVNKTGDATLPPTYALKVHVHEVNATMDNGYPTSYTNSDRRISLIGMIPPLSRVNLTTYNLVVYGGGWATTDNMRVHLCRFATSPAECGALASP